MPTPGKDESKEDFIARCIPQLIDEGKEQDQAVAICMDIWRNKESLDTAVKNVEEAMESLKREIAK